MRQSLPLSNSMRVSRPNKPRCYGQIGHIFLLAVHKDAQPLQ